MKGKIVRSKRVRSSPNSRTFSSATESGNEELTRLNRQKSIWIFLAHCAMYNNKSINTITISNIQFCCQF